MCILLVLIAYVLRNVRKLAKSFVMSVRMEQLGSHWTDFHEIRYLSIFRKSVQNILVRMRNISVTICRQNKTHFLMNNIYIFFENVPFMRKCAKIL